MLTVRVPNVLFIDDDSPFLDGLRRSMHSQRMRCSFAIDFETALEIMDREPIDIVVCDERMPTKSGWEFLGELRESHPTIMRIMLSGGSSMASMVATINRGQVYRYLIKPCPQELLVDTIEKAFEFKLLTEQCRDSLKYLRHINEVIQHIKDTDPDLLAACRGDLPAPGSVSPEIDLAQLHEKLDVEISHARAAFGA